MPDQGIRLVGMDIAAEVFLGIGIKPHSGCSIVTIAMWFLPLWAYSLFICDVALNVVFNIESASLLRNLSVASRFVLRFVVFQRTHYSTLYFVCQPFF